MIMPLLTKIFGRSRKTFDDSRQSSEYAKLKDKYELFKAILDGNNEALKIISDMEEKAKGEYVFDRNYVLKSVKTVSKIITELIGNFDKLSNIRYSGLRQEYERISEGVNIALELKIPSFEKIESLGWHDGRRFTIPLIEIKKELSNVVGSKNGQLGELKNTVEMSVPDGFAITVDAYNKFMEGKKLRTIIKDKLQEIEIKNYKALQKFSEEVQSLVLSSSVPSAVAECILKSYDELHTPPTFPQEGDEVSDMPPYSTSRGGMGKVSVRSSAIGEDTHFSFAGQYKTVLNVDRDNIIDAYKQVIASKFSPKALYYLLSHELEELDLQMAVGCYRQINSVKSGVIYTENPVGSHKSSAVGQTLQTVREELADSNKLSGVEDKKTIFLQNDKEQNSENKFQCSEMLIHAIWGQGKLLVDGMISPDVYSVTKSDGTVISKHIAEKNQKLVIREVRRQVSEMLEVNSEQLAVKEKDSQTVVWGSEKNKLILMESDSDDRNVQVLTDAEINELWEIAEKIERHYGVPQDIEWAIDKVGKIYILQTRPLRIIKSPVTKKIPSLEKVVTLSGGVSACPGAGSGPIFKINNFDDISKIPDKAVIVTRNPIPGLVVGIGSATAFICQVNSIASHLVTIAREFGVPTIVGFDDIEKLKDGDIVTVDATNCKIYEGEYPELVEAMKSEVEIFDEIKAMNLLREINEFVSPLNVENIPYIQKMESLKSLHDILRFIHQKAMEEMFSHATQQAQAASTGLKLKTEIPLKIDIIDLENDRKDNKKNISEKEILSQPLLYFWNGMLHEGWTAPYAPSDLKGMLSVMKTDMTSQKVSELSEKSYAVVGNNFMILSLRMGYHFSTMESFAGKEVSKNYIRMKFKDGGSAFERRKRRIGLISDLLHNYGFEIYTKGDFLDASSSHDSQEQTLNKLYILGRITMLTKQMDFVLTGEDDVENYKTEILEILK